MGKLKLGPILDDKPVKIAIDIPAETHRNLVAYAQALETETGQKLSDPARLIPVMLDRFMASDRAFSPSGRRGVS